MGDICPCCGTPIHDALFKVSMEFNTIICGERALELTPKETEAVFCLKKAWPSLLPTSRLIAQVWGRNPPEEGTLRNTIYTARLKLQTLGYTIRGVRNRGYMLEKMQAKK